MNIRPEEVADYAAIAALHARAFGHRAAEALIVALLRQRRPFDPALSLVAERGGASWGMSSSRPTRCACWVRACRW